MDGLEAVRIIREEINTEYAKNIPIIAFTANAISGNEEMFLSKGFQAFVSKPVEVMQLDAAINQWVRDIELEKTLDDQNVAIGGRTGLERRSGQKDRRIGYDRRLLSENLKKMDLQKGLERFNDDWETYLQIVRSFSSNTGQLLETIKDVTIDTLPNYAITVHGIKSSCRGICAEEAGSKAEALEHAAKAGDLNFVTANNPALIETIYELIEEIEKNFSLKTQRTDKLKKDKPYAEALFKLAKACEEFNATEADAIMEEIEIFDYEADGGLVLWLRENIKQMNFMDIAERLSKESNS
jgi:CheY-like chemotaxis protein